MKKKLYFKIIVLLTVFIIIPFNALAIPSYRNVSFEEALEEAYIVAKGEFSEIVEIERIEGEYYAISGSASHIGKFKITEFIKGKIEEEIIEATIFTNIYEVDKEYIILVQKSQSVFREDNYTVSSSYQMSCDGDLITSIFKRGNPYYDLELDTIDDLKEKFIEYGIDTRKNGTPNGVPYTTSTDPKEIVAFSTEIFIGEVYLNEAGMVQLEIDEEREFDSYKIVAKETLKGEPQSERIEYLFSEGIVEGEKYLILLYSEYREDSYYSAPSSKNSVIPVSDTERYDEYMQHIVKHYKIKKFFQSIKDWFSTDK